MSKTSRTQDILFSNPILTTKMWNDIQSENSKILSSGKECNSFSSVSSTNVIVYGDKVTKKKIHIGSKPERYLWIRTKLSEKLEESNIVDSVIPESKIFTSMHKSLTIQHSKQWDTFFIVKRISNKYLNTLDASLNGIQLDFRSRWITKLPSHNVIFGTSPKDAATSLLRICISRSRRHPTPSIFQLHKMVYIMYNNKLTMIPIDALLNQIGGNAHE